MSNKLEEAGLRDLLVIEAVREQKAYKRSTMLIGIVGLLGLIWIVISASSVVRLERRSSQLTDQIASRERDLERLSGEMRSANDEYRDVVNRLNQAKQALTLAEIELRKAAEANRNPQAEAQRALTAVTNASQAISKDDRLGFLSSDQSRVVTYRGKDGETIEVNVHYNGEEANVRYNLDGTEMQLKGESFSFVLDKNRHNPSRLVLKLGFDSRGGAYKVTITTSGGRSFDTGLRPPGAWFREDSFIFYIL
jgi:hypothetical protein